MASQDEWSERLEVDIRGAERTTKGPRIDEAERLVADRECILIQWQATNRDDVRDLKAKKPTDLHVVIHIKRERSEHRDTLAKEFASTTLERDDRENCNRIEPYRSEADVFIEVANIKGTFSVIGRRDNTNRK